MSGFEMPSGYDRWNARDDNLGFSFFFFLFLLFGKGIHFLWFQLFSSRQE